MQIPDPSCPLARRLPERESMNFMFAASLTTTAGARAKEKLRNMQIECQHYAHEHGIDRPDIDQWTWPY
jgi:phosphoketolase